MADVSPQTVNIRVPITLAASGYHRDHYYEGRPILPAVEALILMARAIFDHFPDAVFSRMTHARFSRLLPLGPDPVDAVVTLAARPDGVAVALITQVSLNQGTMRRTLTHADAVFTAVADALRPEPSCPDCRRLDGPCISVPAFAIYRELVPFGPAYQNITGDLSVSPAGALAQVSGGTVTADERLLGSPFVLDAAMHAACVWGQRFKAVVAFPVGFEERIIYRPTRRGEDYLVRVVPVDTTGEQLIFDVWIFDLNGVVCETVFGLQMRDVTQGRMKPPGWIRQ